MTLFIIITATILFSAFFSGIEIAFVSSNRFHIEVENKKGNFAYKIISNLVQNPSRFIAAMLVGNNIALVVYGYFMPQVLDPLFNTNNPYLLILINTVLSTLLILVFAEFLPKAIFNAHSNRLLEVFAVPSGFFYIIFFPFVSLMIGISNFVMRYILKAKEDEEQQAFNRVDLDNYIRERTETLRKDEDVDHEIQIFRNALEFGDVKAREFMVPRTEVVAMDVKSSVAELQAEFIDSRLSKILIFKDTIDNIIGYVHSFELFKKPAKIREVLRPIGFIPESMAANEILNLLIKDRRSMVVVLDEFGGTSGLVTMEDVVEELFGEIDDEHDTEDLLEKKISDSLFRFSGRQEIDHLNERFNLELPESENYSTLGGLVIYYLESIPEQGEELALGQYLLKVEEVSNAKIDIIQLKITHDD